MADTAPKLTVPELGEFRGPFLSRIAGPAELKRTVEVVVRGGTAVQQTAAAATPQAADTPASKVPALRANLESLLTGSYADTSARINTALETLTLLDALAQWAEAQGIDAAPLDDMRRVVEMYTEDALPDWTRSLSARAFRGRAETSTYRLLARLDQRGATASPARAPSPTEKRILSLCRPKAHKGESIAYKVGLSNGHIRRVLARLVRERRIQITADGYRTVQRAT
jgi:hypothetical protein